MMIAEKAYDMMKDDIDCYVKVWDSNTKAPFKPHEVPQGPHWYDKWANTGHDIWPRMDYGKWVRGPPPSSYSPKSFHYPYVTPHSPNYRVKKIIVRRPPKRCMHSDCFNYGHHRMFGDFHGYNFQ